MYLCICVYIYIIYTCVCIYVSMYLYMYLCIYVSMYVYIHLSIYLSIHPSIHLSIPLSLPMVAEPHSYPMKAPKSESKRFTSSSWDKGSTGHCEESSYSPGGTAPMSCVWGHGWPGNPMCLRKMRINRINHDWLAVSTPPKKLG